MTNILTSLKVNSMNVKDSDKITKLHNIISQNGGRITSKQVAEEGIHRMYIKKLVDSGQLCRVSRGIYEKNDVFGDELYDIQTRYAKGIYSLETALFLHGLTERVPLTWTMTFKSSYHSKSIKNENIQVKYSCSSLYPLEIQTVNTPSGNKVKAYSAERTLCEILTVKANVDIQVILYAVKNYARKKNKDVYKLMKLAKVFHVEKQMLNYLEILL